MGEGATESSAESKAANVHIPSEWGMRRRKSIGGFILKEFIQPPLRRLPWHEHVQASLCFVAAGSYTEQTRGRRTDCPRHSMVFKPAAEPHSDQFSGAGGTCLLVEMETKRLQAIEPFATVMGQPTIARNAMLAAFGQHLYREFRHEDGCSPLAVEGLILETLAEAERSVGTNDASGKPAWLLRALDFINDRFTEPLRLSSVAWAVDVHPSHLARSFRKLHHCSIGEYVRRLRLERAWVELADTDDAVTNIALRLGFFDQSHFSRAFKRHTGFTPVQVRRASRTVRRAGSSCEQSAES